jgi:hypothetical protein
MLRIFHNTSGLTIRKVTDAQGSSSEVVLSPAEVTELIGYLNDLQVTGGSLTFRIPRPISDSHRLSAFLKE